MCRHVSYQTLEVGHGGEGGGGLLGCEGTGGVEDPVVYASAVIQQEADRHLEVLGLFRDR